MKRAAVVIGANYGDEGKGHMVDYLASRLPGKKVVVRFNGGAQAGHIVVTPEGKRHIFGHFGSGTLAGAETYLAKHYVCNPLLFWKEAKELDDLGATMTVAADPRCYITTPYDILLNQVIEDARGEKRHGSVGVGFGETIERNNYPSFRLLKSDLGDADKVMNKLRLIRKLWLRVRCEQLGISYIPADDPRLSDDMLERTAEAFRAFNQVVVTAGAEFLAGKAVIFEGAQGLGLDMDQGAFPHVTRSNTGLTNVVPLARATGHALDVVYMTRTYLTRHGAGPLPGECPPTPEMVDDTNTPHRYQGKLRFAPLDVAAMHQRIAMDQKQAATLINTKTSVGLICTDQVPAEKAAELAAAIGNVQFVSAGPNRDDIMSVT